jgi:CubicO group peptidase (beta-lactamase class C family)
MNTLSFRQQRWVTVIVLLCLALTLTVSAAGAGSVATAQQPDFAAIDAFVEGQVKDLNLPGLALAIVHGDQIVHLKTIGVADPSGRPITPQTSFLLASVTKSFTALAIMQLVEAGKIDLDAPVQRYLPWFRVADAAASARITVRHLLNQTSGLSTLTGNGNLITRDSDDGAQERFVRGLSTASLSSAPGTSFEYSNANYATLGAIVAAVSGQSYEQYVEDHIFTPLDMQNSFMYRDEARRHGMATGYTYLFGVPSAIELPDLRGGVAAGGVIASAEDMGHYLSALLNEGRYGDNAIVSPQALAQLWQRPPGKAGEDNSYYGMGWQVNEDWPFGVPFRDHNGEAGNFHAYMALLPESNYAIAILVNASHQFWVSVPIDLIGWGVISLLAGQDSLPTRPDVHFLRGIYIAAFVVLAVLIIDMISSIRTLRRWRAQPDRRPHSRRQLIWHVVLPLLGNLLAGYLFMIGVPQMFGVPLEGALLFAPDFGYAILLIGVIGFGWGIARTVLAIWVLRQPRADMVRLPVGA